VILSNDTHVWFESVSNNSIYETVYHANYYVKNMNNSTNVHSLWKFQHSLVGYNNLRKNNNLRTTVVENTFNLRLMLYIYIYISNVFEYSIAKNVQSECFYILFADELSQLHNNSCCGVFLILMFDNF